ncbi:MAG: DUF4340 domain-containing protein, partial [bacterium]|nr:DUF4340 domain-containing protein [bacterium]
TDGKVTVLEKKSGKWKVASNSGLLKADETAVRGVLGALGKITKEEIASINKDKWRELGVEKGLRVKIEGGEGSGGIEGIIKGKKTSETEFFVGREGLVWTKNYLRFTGDDRTYLSGENLKSALTIGDWVDKTATRSGEKK